MSPIIVTIIIVERATSYYFPPPAGQSSGKTIDVGLFVRVRRLAVRWSFKPSSRRRPRACINSDVNNVIPSKRVSYVHLRASSFPVWQNASPVSRGLRAEGVAPRRARHQDSWHQYYSQVPCRGRWTETVAVRCVSLCAPQPRPLEVLFTIDCTWHVLQWAQGSDV